MAEAVRTAVFCTLLGPTLALGSLLGLGSGSPGADGDPGIGGLLDTGLLGGGRGGLGGVLGGVLGGGKGKGGEDVLGGVLGGDEGKGGGLLGGVLGGDGGKGGGPLGGVLGGDEGKGGGLLGGVLGGDEGKGGGLLGGVLGGDEGKGGGLLGGVLGGDEGKGGGLLGGVLGGDEGKGGGLLGGVLGGDGGKGGGPLGGVLGGDGGKGGGLLGGVLGDVGDLLNNTTNSVLTGGGLPGGGGLLNGVLDQNSLGNILGGEKGLLGLPGVLNGNLLGLDNGKPKEPFQWYNVLNLQFIRGSWKIIHGTELILNLQATIIMKLPGPLFRNGVSVDVNITAHLAITQDKPGDLKLVLKNCQDLVAGFTIKLPPSLIAMLINRILSSAIQSTLPAVICPIFQFWINVVNVQLQALNDYAFFGLLGRIHAALTSMPVSTGQFSELDLKDKPFPGAFLKWLLNYADSDGKPKFP